MPSAPHTILLALHAAALVAFMATSTTTTIYAVASPLPMPFPALAADYSLKTVTSSDLQRRPFNSTMRNGRETAHNPRPPRAVLAEIYSTTEYSVKPRSSLDADWTKMNRYAVNAGQNARKLKHYAAQSATVGDNDGEFRQRCADEITGFHTNLLGFQTLLAQLGADKGLANYDRNNDLETLLKNVVNFNKDVLSAVDVLVRNIPLLGPLLGPTVYELKCLLDEVLNAVENLTDAIINALSPLLLPVIRLATISVCTSSKSGAELLDLCI